jgi:hypothetical protein
LVDVKERTYYIFLQDAETSTRRGIERKDCKEHTRDGTILVEQGGGFQCHMVFLPLFIDVDHGCCPFTYLDL